MKRATLLFQDRRRCLLLAVGAVGLGLAVPAAAIGFDPTFAAFDALLRRHVRWLPDGHASQVDYAGLQQDRPALQACLADFSAVTAAEFDGWNKPARRAFLINAYNAFTLELILTKYPELASIKDLGGLFSSPWKQRFFRLLGEPRHLDDVEHGLLRGAPDYDDPRIHFAVNCASVGCPALRPEAYVGERLDAQLDDQTRRFLGDRHRNRADASARRLTLSPIFSWYKADFARGLRGAASVMQFVANYPESLGLTPEDVAALRRDEWSVGYGDYDWSLNRVP